MTRTREFDEDTVLRSAMHAFRRDGYSGVSIKTLERETGLSSGSLYNGFGNKDEIFRRSVAHYNRTVVQKRICEHLQSKPPREGLRSLFLSLLKEPGGSTFGCLLTNSAIELGATEMAAKADVKEGFDLFLEAFIQVVKRLVDAGDVTWSKSIQNHVPLKLLTLYQGVLVLVRSGHPLTRIEKLIRTELTLLLDISTAKDWHDD